MDIDEFDFGINGDVSIVGMDLIKDLNKALEKTPENLSSIDKASKTTSNSLQQDMKAYESTLDRTRAKIIEIKNALNDVKKAKLTRKEQQELNAFTSSYADQIKQRHNYRQEKELYNLFQNLNGFGSRVQTAKAQRAAFSQATGIYTNPGTNGFVTQFESSINARRAVQKAPLLLTADAGKSRDKEWLTRNYNNYVNNYISNKENASVIEAQQRAETAIKKYYKLKEDYYNKAAQKLSPDDAYFQAELYQKTQMAKNNTSKLAAEAIKKSHDETTSYLEEKKYGISKNEMNTIEKDFDSWSKKLDKEISAGFRDKLSSSIQKTNQLFNEWKTKKEQEANDLIKIFNQSNQGKFVGHDFQDAFKARMMSASNHNFNTIINGSQQLALPSPEEMDKKGIKKQILDAEERIAEAKKQEAKAAEENAKTEKDIKKAKAPRPMTENQIAKNQRAIERNATSAKNANTRAGELAEKKRIDDDLEDFRKYKNEHPDEFTSSVRNSKKYKASHAIGEISSALGNNNGIIGRTISDSGSIASAAIMGGWIGALIAGVAKITAAVNDFSKASEQAYANVESLKTQLSIVFGNESQSAQMFSDISRYAVKSPFGVEQTTELATLLRQSGVEATRVMDTLKMLGDTAGGNMEKMKRIANNYAQIVSIGKASMLDMRQFAYAGIPIFEKVSEELGVSQTKLRKLISDGKVTAEIVEKVFKDMTGINGIFENATERGAKTLKSRTQNLQDAKNLALAGAGEYFARIGEGKRKRNDPNYYQGYKFGRITMAEDFYTKIGEIATFKNLEKSVNNIELESINEKKLQKEIKDLENKAIGGTITAQESISLEKKRELLNLLQGLLTPDMIRSQQSQLYELDRDRVLSGKDAALIENQYKELRKWWEGKIFTLLTAGANYITGDFGRLPLDIFYEIRKGKNKKNIKKAQERQDELALSHAEYIVQQTQQVAADKISYDSKGAVSYKNIASDILARHEETDKYKKEQEEITKKQFTDVYNELKDINKNTAVDGKVNYSKIGYKRFKELEDKKAFESAEKLATTNDNQEKAKADFPQLIANTAKAAKDIREAFEENHGRNSIPSLSNTSTLLENFLESNAVANSLNYGNVKFGIDEYNKVVDQIYKNIEEALKGNLTPEQRESAEKIKDILATSTLRGVLVQIDDSINIDELFQDKIADQFQPLWKRILGNSLGYSPAAVTSEKDALDFYQKDLAVRNTAGKVLTTALKEGMSVSKLQEIMSPTKGQTTLKKGGKKWQIDWEEVRKNLKEFSSGLSASSTVLKSFKSGVEEEYETFVNLLGSGIYQTEQNGLKAMYVSAKQLDKNWTTEDEIGVNAFGEILKNEFGEVVTKIDENGIAWGKDKDGKEYILENQNLVITDKIYEEMKARLPELQKELVQLDKDILKKEVGEAAYEKNWFKSVIPSLLPNMSSYGIAAFTEHEDRYKTLFRDILGSSLQGTRFEGRNVNEVINAAMGKGNAEEFDDAVQLFYQAVQTLKASLPDNDSLFVNYRDTTNADNIERNTKDYEAYQKLIEGRTASERTKNYKYLDRNLLGVNDILSAAGMSEDTDFSALAAIAAQDEKYFLANKYNHDALISGLEKEMKQNLASNFIEEELANLKSSFMTTLKDDVWKGFLSPFETMGDDLLYLIYGTKEWNDVLKDVGHSMQGIAGDIVAQTGKLATNAGLALIQSGAMTQNWGMIIGGLALAAAGGFTSSLGSAIANYGNEKEKDEDKEKRLQSLTDQLKELLEQARADALYYEKNLRHKTALGISDRFSYTAVNDAIITKKGEVIKTSPEDYLIATKTPQNLGGNTVVQPKINFSVIDNVGVNIKQEQRQNSDGSIDLVAVIENTMAEYIASSRSDDAFGARQYRLNGRSGIM